ncbi:MAG TPA: LysR family transcriptional regulator [Kofleriaceae bacterium]|jgi:DNA-binding transcriptional LysR family regulator
MQDARMYGGLDVLAAVVETRSFVAAGERVGLTQSGVSRAIARLEERVGVRLFDRNPRAVTLTDEGRQFHERIAPLLSQLGEALDGAADAASRVRGRLRVAVDAFFGRYVLGPRLPAFLAAYPELSVEVVSRDHTHALSLVGEGFDVAIRFDEPRGASTVVRRLLETRIITCCSPAYIAQRGRPRQPQDLAGDHDCIQFIDPATGRPYSWEFHSGRRRIRDVRVHGQLVVNDVGTALSACLAGYGIGQLMALGTEQLREDGALVELFPRWSDEMFPLYVLLPSRANPPAKVRAFIDFIVASAKDTR